MLKNRMTFAVAISLLSLTAGCQKSEPRDQEECKLSAAKEAKTNDSLKIMLSLCETEFPATRKIGGGYEWRGHLVSGPKPTDEEVKRIAGHEVSHYKRIASEKNSAQPRYLVTTRDGRKFEVTLRENTNIEQAIDEFENKVPFISQ